MSDTAGTTPPEDPSKREAAAQALQAWGEEVKQQIAAALDQKLDELGSRLQSFGGQ